MNRGRIRVQLYHERDDENVLDNVNRPLNPDLRTRPLLHHFHFFFDFFFFDFEIVFRKATLRGALGWHTKASVPRSERAKTNEQQQRRHEFIVDN